MLSMTGKYGRYEYPCAASVGIVAMEMSKSQLPRKTAAMNTRRAKAQQKTAPGRSFHGTASRSSGARADTAASGVNRSSPRSTDVTSSPLIPSQGDHLGER